jgi:hypothetical protein
MPRSDVEFLRISKHALLSSLSFRMQTTRRAHRRQLVKEDDLRRYLAQLAEWVYSDIATQLAEKDTEAAVKLLQAVDDLEKSEKEQDDSLVMKPSSEGMATETAESPSQ